MLSGGRVLHAEGVTGLLGPLEAELPDPSQLRGNLAHDLGVAMAAGFPLDRVLDAAALGLGLFLATLVDRVDVHAHLQPQRAAPTGSLPLPEPLLRLFARGLREVRSPAVVANALHPWWDAALLPGRWRAEQYPGMDPIALRTLRLTRPGMTLGELIVASGRHQQERTAWAWRSVDLLLQLGFLRLEGAATGSLGAGTLRFKDERPAERVNLTEGPPPAPPVAAPGPAPAATAQAAAPEAPEVQPLPSDADVLELVTRCSELNPLVVLDLQGIQLFDVFTLQGLQAAFQREATRFRPEVFLQSSPNTLDAVSALDEIFRSSREALRDPSIASLWLRELRAFADPLPEAPDEDAARARERFEEAQALVARRDWRPAQHLAEQAVRLDPRQVRYRILDIFCRVALRAISPLDGVLNLDALWLSDPKDHALALVTSGRLLKAAGRRSQALQRFRAALELDPDRADARRELEGAG